MLHRLCEPPSIPLSFSLATILPRRGTSRFPSGREPIGEPPTQCPSFTARTTGVSNPVRSPGFSRLSVRRRPGPRFRHGRSFRSQRISPLHRKFQVPLRPSRPVVLRPLPRLSRGFQRPTCGRPPTRALSPVIPNNVRTVRLTAAAGTNLARASSRDQSRRLRPFSPPRQEFTTRRPSSSTRRRSVRLAPIAEDSRLQPPVGVWAVSQSQCAGPRSHAR